MPKTSKRAAKDQKRWAKLSNRIIARMCSSEDYGLLDEAAEFECLHDTVETAWLGHNSEAKNHLCLYFGAPENAVDLEKALANPAYRRHHTASAPTITPPALQCYIKARNARVAKFRKWSPSGSHPEALVQTLQRLVRSTERLSEQANRARNSVLSARRKEIQAMTGAIELCCAEALANTPSASKSARCLRSDPSFVPWHLCHAYLLHDLAAQDLEATTEQLKELGEVVALLRAYQSAP